VKEIDTKFDEISISDFISRLNDTKLFILGEMHGVQENPNIIYTIFKKFGFKNIAIEWSDKLQEAVNFFLKTGDIDFDKIKNSDDGRITAGHFALLKKLKEEGLLEKVICFDEWSNEWNDREKNMANNIIKNILNTPILVIAGNLHAKMDSFKDKSNSYHPMGENIKNKIQNVPNGKIEYLKGEYYNLSLKEFKKSNREKLPKAEFYKSSDGTYMFILPEAHAGSVPNQLN
jgi:uncharacterized iron-regulated protein